MTDRPWILPPEVTVPAEFVATVQQMTTGMGDRHAAQLLWQRGLRQPEQLAGFLNPQLYQPTSPFAFGEEMEFAVVRLEQAWTQGERVAIWGDFDADGVTATAVLWEGLGQFFPPEQLSFFIPNRLTDSHGLSCHGIDILKQQGPTLIVTCDTGSTNLTEINYARSLGIDVIITDHHTMPDDRPPVVAFLNPRRLSSDHPCATLSGVAMAYKLVEALYERFPAIPQQPLAHLLDLVAIGLIADLVELKGDCRYLAQQGIARLQTQRSQPTRPGVARLLELCKRTGDRPTDISFGLGPRINAVSRIQGDARFCVELLTSRDPQRCHKLAAETELANTRRKGLQREVYRQAIARLQTMDLSTTRAIVLLDDQWPAGILGLVAGQIAQEYGLPTILLSSDSAETSAEAVILARGSARSIGGIDLYQLFKDQAALLHRFGGHPLAAGLSLPIENVPLFAAALNQQLRQQAIEPTRSHQADLVVTVADLGKDLFRQLKLLEPCGMGNPTPKLLLRNCWCEPIRNKKIKDLRGRDVQYVYTEFLLRDDSTVEGFPGLWWGHYRDDLPRGRCDVLVELDSNDFRRQYEVRLLAIRSHTGETATRTHEGWILDWRQVCPLVVNRETVLLMPQCPVSWHELQICLRLAIGENRSLALAYPPPSQLPAEQVWHQLVGIAKYLSRTGQTVTRQQLSDRLELRDRPLQLGFQALQSLGFELTHGDQGFQIRQPETLQVSDPRLSEVISPFLQAVQEEQFRRQYFYQLPTSVLEKMLLR